MKMPFLLVAVLASLQASAEQLWLGQGVSVRATESLRLGFHNTIYVVHGKHCYNEEVPSIRWSFASNWTAVAGMTFAQALTQNEGGRHHWIIADRATEHFALDWHVQCGGWYFNDSNCIYTYFREGERDWPVYRNVATVTAPKIPLMPCSPRPYLSQQVYLTGRERYSGLDRFSQFHTTIGMGMRPFDCLYLAAYWQCRNIESQTEDWTQVRVAGLSATLLF